MTWRAFLIGVVLVAGISLITPYNDFDLANTYMTGFHFPVGAFFLLMVLTLAANTCLKLARRAWALRQSELMLMWCMMIVSATVPSSGLMRYYYGMMAAPSYFAADSPQWAETGHLLREVPEELVLSTEVRAPEAEAFYHGTPKGEKVRIPWRSWARPILTWGVFVVLFYLATFFACAVLRGWWVDAERLTFPLAVVPMELTEGAEDRLLLPALVRSKFFLMGAGLSLLGGVLRLSPLVTSVGIRLDPLMQGSALESGQFGWTGFYPMAIGFAFLLPAQISFSFWFFRLFTRFEYITAYQMGLPVLGGDYGPFAQWQQAGAFIAFTAIMLWQARRHIAKVASKAVGRGGAVDDSHEPIGFRTAFWGLGLSVAGMIGWSWHFGMSPLTAIFWLGLVLCLLLVHARVVSQGGMFFTQQSWAPVSIVHSITGGYGFSAPAIVVANMQHAMLMSDAREVLSAHAMNALRISSVFEKRRRLFLPAMLAALAVALVVAGWSSMHVYYSTGAHNLSNNYGPCSLAPGTLNTAEWMITRPKQSAEGHYGAMGLGVAVMAVLLGVRTWFHWWPIHPLGFLIATTYAMGTMWLSFFLGWLVKVLVTQVGGGKLLRQARSFFLGVIAMEAFMVGTCAVLGCILKTRIGGFIFLPG